MYNLTEMNLNRPDKGDSSAGSGRNEMRAIALLFCASTLFAQSGGTITGTILNLPGDAVANAPVQATNAATRAVYKATSSENGQYTLAQLPAGTYEVSVALT